MVKKVKKKQTIKNQKIDWKENALTDNCNVAMIVKVDSDVLEESGTIKQILDSKDTLFGKWKRVDPNIIRRSLNNETLILDKSRISISYIEWFLKLHKVFDNRSGSWDNWDLLTFWEKVGAKNFPVLVTINDFAMIVAPRVVDED